MSPTGRRHFLHHVVSSSPSASRRWSSAPRSRRITASRAIDAGRGTVLRQHIDDLPASF
jgi:hypothetical protein